MILFEIKKYLNNPKLLQVNVHSFEKTWHSYWKQYHTATICVLNASTEGLNPVFMPFMQLLRHSYELFLKESCIAAGRTDGILWSTHSVADLEKESGIFNSMPLTLNDTVGDTFRYHINRDGEPHFTEYKLSLLDDCRNYFSFIEKNNSETIRSNNPFQGKHFESRYVVYPSECNALGLVSTQYDEALHILLENIKNKVVSIDDVCMPFLFLVRHSTELKLKQSLRNLGDAVKDSAIIYSTHSFEKLWDELSRHYKDAIEMISDLEFKNESEIRFQDAEQFVNKINEKDANSLIFRYPELKKENPSNFKPYNKIVIDYLNMMNSTDAFLCFAVGVLAEAGTLQLGNDILHELFD